MGRAVKLVQHRALDVAKVFRKFINVNNARSQPPPSTQIENVLTDCDPALALLSDLPVFADAAVASNMEIVGVTALALGLICVGSCNDDVTTTLLQTLMEKSEKSSLDLKDAFAKFLPLGIGLCFLGKQDAADATIATLEVLPEPFKSMATTLVDICAYAGTGNVLKIQSLLHICSEHYEPAEKEDKKDSKGKDDKKEEKKDDNATPGALICSFRSLTLRAFVFGFRDEAGEQSTS